MKESTCTYDPNTVHGAIGMHHCPECGEMQLAGWAHLGIMEDADYLAMEDDMMARTIKQFPTFEDFEAVFDVIEP
jgi:hypothetical protein